MKRKIFYLVFLSLIVVFVLTEFSQASSNPDIEDGNPQTIDELINKIDSLLQEQRIPGAGIALVSKNSIIWMGGVGLADVESGASVTENTSFQIGSCTKSFIGLGFLKLVAEGKIDLNTPVQEIVPEIEIDNPWRETNPVRVIHLLEHTSGFDESRFSAANLYFDRDASLKQILEAETKSRKVRWPPGTRYAYSNPGYSLAGYILEKITGQRYDVYLKRNILEPVGMTTSTFQPTEESRRSLSKGYNNNYQPIPSFHMYNPAGSLISSAKEMALFVQFLINKGKMDGKQIIGSGSIDNMGLHTTTIAAEAGLYDIGYSYGVSSRFKAGFKWYGHTGGIFGYASRFSYVKEYELGCVILTNNFNVPGLDKIHTLIFEYLFRGVEKPIKPSMKISSEKLKRYSGYYEFRGSRQELFKFMDILLGGTKIMFKNDKLYLQRFMSVKTEIIPVSANTFRRSEEPEASMAFTENHEGNSVFVDSKMYYEKTGAWKPFVHRILVFASFIVMLTSVIYGFFWIPVHIFKKITGNENRSKYLRMRLFPFIAVLSLIFGILAVVNQPLYEISDMTVNNIVFFVLTLLFAGLSVISLVFSIISFYKPVRMIACLYAVVLSIACFGMTVYLSYWGFIGLRIWVY